MSAFPTASPGCDEMPSAAWLTRYETAVRFLPFALLAISTGISLIGAGTPSNDRLTVAALAALAACWTAAMNAFASPARRDNPVNGAVYFFGLLVFAAVLISLDVVFFVFTISGFFQAFLLRPWQLGFAGIGVCSVILNTGTMGVPSSLGDLAIYLTVIVIQTGAIGSGVWLSQRDSAHAARREELVRQLQEALEENAGLHTQLLEQARERGVQDERERLAREIHDTIAQGLAGIITQLQAAERENTSPTDRRRHLDNATRLARDSLDEARRSVSALRPAPLASDRLPDALAGVTQRWSELHKVPVEFTVVGDPTPLHPALDAVLLRTAQEALTNVAKHAAASRVGVTVSYMDASVALDVRDDGIGFDPGAVPTGANGNGGFGLTGMRQRVRGLTGRLSVESEPGAGTAISINLPAYAAAGPETVDEGADDDR